ncbi:putative fimbrial subunit [Xenorhabdus sp. PB62.4]|nr:fimbrial protein [Xenorhabdus sp. PB62.4]MBC8953469.1 putative fimbrial subunit [Xenorhabdus sp. PB62.4]
MIVSVFAASNNGNITFTGKVTKGTCSTAVVGDSGSVNMLDVGVGDFTAKSDAKGDTDFKIELKNCKSSGSSLVKVAFTGGADSDDTKVLRNNAKGSAAVGVGIGIYKKSDGSQIAIGSVPVDVDTLPARNTAFNKELPFIAKYVATKDIADIKAGLVTANANFTVSYD